YTDRIRHPLPLLGLANPPRRLPGGAVVSTFDLLTVGVAAALFLALFAFLRLSPLGIQMRAAGEKALLAAQRGINFQLLFALSWALAGFAGALAGILYAHNVRLDPSHGGGYFKTTYASDLALVDTRLRRTALAALIVALLVLPRLTSPFALDLVAQTALAAVGALALNLLTGLAGQISLGHAGFIAAGAFTTAVLVEHRLPSPLLALPAAALVSAVLGVVVGIPALRLKGLYLALGTLALHHVVLYACGEFQNHWGANTGVSIPPPRL